MTPETVVRIADPAKALLEPPAADRPSSAPPAVEPLLIDRRELARLLSVGIATLDRMRAAGRIPPPLMLSSGCVRWRLDEVRSWLAAAAPSAAVWAALQAAQRNGRA